VPPNSAYIKLTLNFNLSGNASANWSSGPYGVKSSLDTGVDYAITFCKSLLPSTKVSDALSASFTSFVLPFNSETLAQMHSGDFLQHEFDGTFISHSAHMQALTRSCTRASLLPTFFRS
jgi:hypothetical protein